MEPLVQSRTQRKELREGRSFNPDEFAIALEQVVAGTEDYRQLSLAQSPGDLRMVR